MSQQAQDVDPQGVDGGVVVYGVVPAGTSLDESPGLGGAAVRAVTSGRIAAVVSSVEAPDFKAARRDLMRHSEVLGDALEHGPVLPLRFGTVFRDDAAVASNLLSAHADELEALLAQFENAVELRVKGFYDEEAMLRHVVTQNPAIARLRESVHALPDAASYAQRLRLGELVARAVEAERSTAASAVLDALRPLAQSVVADSELALGVLLSCSFLVERSRVPQFDRAMDELAGRYRSWIKFKYVGPLPPHSFVAMPESR